MTHSKPLVSIGMPVYNGEKYIRRALDSLLAQDYENVELIISDNASTDATWQICQEYAARDARIKLNSNERNLGSIANFGIVLNMARGPYFMWAAADDYWLPEFVSVMVSELGTHPEADVAMCAIKRVRRDGSLVRPYRCLDAASPNRMSKFALAMALVSGKPYWFIYGLFRTDFIRRAFPRFPRVYSGDVLFVCELALATRFRYVDQVLFISTRRNEPVATRFPGERYIHGDFVARLKLIAMACPYLMSSRLIPWHRKPFVPLLALRFAGLALLKGHTFMSVITTLVRSVLPPTMRRKIRQLLGRDVR